MGIMIKCVKRLLVKVASVLDILSTYPTDKK